MKSWGRPVVLLLSLAVVVACSSSSSTGDNSEPDNIVTPFDDTGSKPQGGDVVEGAGGGSEQTGTLPDEDAGHQDAGEAQGGDIVLPDDTGTPTDEDVPTVPQDIPPAQCVDKDGDGYGDNCYLGKDCDDLNPNFNIYCPPCQQQSVEGCKCQPEGAAEVCYDGDPGSVGIGECQLGQRFCTGGFWTACTGQVVPQPENCDNLDNDCDGTVDEGVLSPCGDCDPFCDTLEIGPDGQEDFEPTEENSEKVGLNIDGFLTLDSTKVDLAFIWIANSSANTVSKLDTKKCVETGRYSVCSNPSRTAVDLIGNVWAGCRNDGAVVKIAIDEALCIDKNGNGVIDTAKDTNGDGKVVGAEVYPTGQDECILFVTYPGGSCQRGLGVDKDNYAWVGEWYGAVLRRLHPDTGQVVQSINIPNNPYGLVIDQENVIWVSGRGGNKLVRVDPETGQVNSYSSNIGCFQPYGITLDYKGRVWIGNCCCNHVGYRFDPLTSTWAAAPTASRPRGVAGSSEGMMYVANDESSKVAKVDSDTMQTLGYANLGGGRFPVGMAIDFEGHPWAVNQSASSASKIDPDTMQVLCEVPVGSGPYTYSDMTGYALHNFTAPQGYYSHVFGGWEGFRVQWTAVYVDVEYGDPEFCFVKVRVRTADTPEELAAAPWQGFFGPYPPETFPLDLTVLPDMDGRMLEVEVTLHSESKTCTPLVKSIEAKFESNQD